MKASFRVLTVLAAMAGATSLVSASTIVDPIYSPSLNPTNTFGTPQFSGGQTTAVVESLSSLASYLVPGYSISFNAVGEVCYSPSQQGCTSSSTAGETSVSAISNPIIGGFVGSGGLGGGFLGSFTLTGPQQTAVLTDWTSLVSNTFIVTSTGTGPLVIPTGATGVVFVFLDDLYGDNSDASGTLNVDATFNSPSSAPEPATYGMMIAGLGALVAFKRYRRS